MDAQPWRVVIVRAWLHDDEVAAVLLVGGEQSEVMPARRLTAGSIEAACAVLAAILGELTEESTEPTTPGRRGE
jgi:hypothetical protein